MTNKICKMVSIDSSSSISGYAYFENGILKNSGRIDLHKEKDSEIRIENMCLNLIDILNQYKPDIVVVEMTVVTRGAATQRMLSEIVGVIRGWALCNYAEFVRLRPSEWRKLVKNDDEFVPKKREELKIWSANKVNEIYNKEVEDDESDAILLGLARINQFRGL